MSAWIKSAFRNRLFVTLLLSDIATAAGGRRSIPAVRQRLSARRINTITETAKPSHAPRDHVRTRQNTSKAAPQAKAKRSFALFAVSASATVTGIIRMRYSPRTLGFAKVETTLPFISPKSDISCQITDGEPMKFSKIP